MSETAPKPKRSAFGRILFALVFLCLVGAGLYGASWLNARRYFLIVEKAEARVEKGRMLPFGHYPYLAKEIALRKAYEAVPLPGGMKLPRGETVFTDRVELDQALYRLLRDAAEYSLTADNERTSELTGHYLAQLRALPGITAQQQVELQKLERDATYVKAKGLFAEANRKLIEAEKLFRASAKGGNGRNTDGQVRASRIGSALQILAGQVVVTLSDSASAAPRKVLATTATKTSTATGK